MILKLILGCVSKFYVGNIQAGYADFLPPQVCGMSLLGFQLGVKTCLIKVIYLIDLKYPSISLFKPSFLLLTCVYHINYFSVH